MPSRPLTLAYYCSGHGYGHATRVSAFTRHLLSVGGGEPPTIYIVSSAPEHVFADSIAYGARYRCAEIDPVIIQPLAYRVDRQKSIDALKKFLDKKDELLERERLWLSEIKAISVLSDAAFLGCLAAKSIGIPSVLITNFTFDSVYSYLSTLLLDVEPSCLHADTLPSLLDLSPDDPIPLSELSPLVRQIYHGYQCADLLVRLPGYIPIPSFFSQPKLPSFKWVDVETRRLLPEVVNSLASPCDERTLHPALPFPDSGQRKVTPRSVLEAPLIVRPPSSNLSVYTLEGRSRFLSSIGVPVSLHNPNRTKILVVSFGGQVFRKPSRSPSRPSSRNQDRDSCSPDVFPKVRPRSPNQALKPKNLNGLGLNIQDSNYLLQDRIPNPNFDLHIPSPAFIASPLFADLDPLDITPSARLATPCHLWIPGAPPASKPIPAPQSPTVDVPLLNMVPPTPGATFDFSYEEMGVEDWPQLLPDSSWIAIVCGVSKEQWNSQGEGPDSELPEGFYVAPKYVYMPDLTAIGDVLLGKLGYGTVSECVDACTPFVYVSRPLFIEEHGLRLLLDQEGVGVELPRQSYEAGDWAPAVAEALMKGKEMKARKRRDMANGIEVDKREREGRALAKKVTAWIRAWWADDDCQFVLA